MGDDGWNHNVHYHPLLLGLVPDGCARALDLGCGDGTLARKLAGVAGEVTGVDRSPEMIAAARARCADTPGVRFAEADFPGGDVELFAPGSYDFVCAVAVLHHLELAAGLREMARLVAPGGRLAIVGLARNETPLDWAVAAAGVPAARLLARRNGGKTDPPGMPVRDPIETWAQVRREAHRLLPGCRFRRHLLWRYSLVWHKPPLTEVP
ncbi:class I SAM-dependent methyltransferase [Actinomadura atramentaria]|uniref:class I SAM-dependent methyltransferase n=1 Tax=Actinomadura atramentaria TaxID=1990 RepID=UPI00035D510B|nr:class I SAM-dependent methyltransferase [Actinomadura atramentaria]